MKLTIDPILNENLRRILGYKNDSGYFELEDRKSESFIGKGFTKDMNAKGSFKDNAKYIFKHNITDEVFIGTMKTIAAISLRNKWHQGSWCGTQLVKRIGSQRSLLTFLGEAKCERKYYA